MEKDSLRIIERHQEWLDTKVTESFVDYDLLRIIIFFVIEAPCPGQSARTVSLQKRGWKKDPWYSKTYLKDKLDKAIFGEQKKMIKMVERRPDISDKFLRFECGDEFYKNIKLQRALYVKVNKDGCQNEYMSLFYHLRNALAHGRMSAYYTYDDDIMFVFEDGKPLKNNKFEVTARMVLRKSSLLKVIEILMNPPEIKDYRDDVLTMIKEGKNKKSQIIKELMLDENEYKETIKKLKLGGMIYYEKGAWEIVKK